LVNYLTDSDVCESIIKVYYLIVAKLRNDSGKVNQEIKEQKKTAGQKTTHRVMSLTLLNLGLFHFFHIDRAHHKQQLLVSQRSNTRMI
jgi:hypothetical protein|tara:strand:- start:6662 stop:6925 length:264 start_codon:yes stop_codon:yes gene_type:complete